MTYEITQIALSNIHKCMNKNELSWDVYRTFVAVLEEGSLSGAARRLGLTQPSVGRHIDRLEDVAIVIRESTF